MNLRQADYPVQHDAHYHRALHLADFVSGPDGVSFPSNIDNTSRGCFLYVQHDAHLDTAEDAGFYVMLDSCHVPVLVRWNAA